MRILIFTTLFLLISFILDAQDVRLKVGIEFEPCYSYRFLQDDPVSSFQLAEFLDSKDQKQFGYKLGIGVEYRIIKRFSILSGFIYSKTGFLEDYDLVFTEPEPFFDYATRVNHLTDYQFYYLNIPLQIKLKIIETNKFNFYFNGGLVGNYLLDYAELITVSYNGVVEESDYYSLYRFNHIKNFNVSQIIGVGLSYNPYKNFSIEINPSFSSQLMNLETDKILQTKLYDYGVILSFNFAY